MGHGTLEWVYVGVVVAVLIYIGADAWNVETFLDHAPEDAQVVKVTAQQWFWTFEHEDGRRELGELHLVKDIPYRFEVTSLDVIHSFNTPDFAMMIDAVPGRINSISNTMQRILRIFALPDESQAICGRASRRWRTGSASD
jgi:cytochrome c oxidase subunit 2